MSGTFSSNDLKEKKGPPAWAKIVVGVVVAIVVIAVIASFAGGSGGNSGTETSTYTGPEVEYVITGSAASVDVTLSNPTGGTEQYSDVPLPHTYSYNSFPNYFLYISAQNNGESGTVTTTIYLDGAVYKTSTSSGAYVIASASGSK